MSAVEDLLTLKAGLERADGTIEKFEQNIRLVREQQYTLKYRDGTFVPEKGPEPPPLSEAFERYLREFCSRKNAESTIARKKSRIPIIRKFFGDPRVDELVPTLVEQFLIELLDAGRTTATCNRYLNLITGMLKECVKWGVVSKEQLYAVRALRADEAHREARPLTGEDEAVFLTNCPDQLVPVYEWAVSTGLRQSQCVAAKIDQVHADANVFIVRRGKGRKDRVVPLRYFGGRALKLLATLERKRGDHVLQSSHGTPWTQSGLHSTFYRWIAKCGLKIRFHDLRATFATRLALDGVAPAKIQAIMGHMSIQTTMGYINVAAVDPELRLPLEVNDENQ